MPQTLPIHPRCIAPAPAIGGAEGVGVRARLLRRAAAPRHPMNGSGRGASGDPGLDGGGGGGDTVAAVCSILRPSRPPAPPTCTWLLIWATPAPMLPLPMLALWALDWEGAEATLPGPQRGM